MIKFKEEMIEIAGKSYSEGQLDFADTMIEAFTNMGSIRNTFTAEEVVSLIKIAKEMRAMERAAEEKGNE